VENRLVGMKSRGVYETPGGTILHEAHQALESITLDRQTSHFKTIVANRYADLVYDGQWFSPLREALDSFVDTTQETVTGEVLVELYKGSASAVGRRSPFSLYSEQFATFGEDEVYRQSDAEGFIRLFGLPQRIRHMANKANRGEVPPTLLKWQEKATLSKVGS
jgi:argininosuccinate synthase